MGDAYRNADRVFFWLGSGMYETNMLIDSLKELEKQSLKHRCIEWSSQDIKWLSLWQVVHLSPMVTKAHEHPPGFQTLPGRPWCRRIWIVQEVVNTKAAIVCCGTGCLSARIFVLAPYLTVVQPDKHCQGILDSMPSATKRMSSAVQPQEIYTPVKRFDGSKASDKRDLVFALVGLYSYNDAAARVDVHYSKAPQEVVISLLSYLFPF